MIARRAALATAAAALVAGLAGCGGNDATMPATMPTTRTA